ncbi:hypothetical protein DXG01_014579 [Tephrocybe rancida]|nr:hypothetical protein DXG01_014579 [Tephrocybe rancida]
MFELVKALNDGAQVLKTRSSNPISLNAGCELFIAFVTLFPHDSVSFADLKTKLIRQGQKYVDEALTYRRKIAELAVGFIKDGSVTAEALTAAGIPSTVILDSAVAYVMEKVDFVLVGSEAVVESGGLVNAVGSNQIAIIAKAANKPFYALAERWWFDQFGVRNELTISVSYKFHRLFPLSQYDLPNENTRIFSFPRPKMTSPRIQPQSGIPFTGSSSSPEETLPTDVAPMTITQEQISQNNPDVDYTRPDLISLVFSDVGSLTPEGVSQYLVGMFAG